MKIKFSLAARAGLCLLTLAGSLQATTTNIITVKANPTAGGDVSGGGKYVGTTNALATATANGCYLFTDWTVAGLRGTITNNPLSFTVSNENVTLTANFEQLKYVISTSSSPTNGGTISGGGTIDCGATAKLTARAKPGFAFTAWTSSLEVPNTNKEISFVVNGPESFVAHFKDIQPPTIAITAPGNNEKITTSAFPLEGTAKDNVAVAAVYYSLNGGAWTPAYTVNGFAYWYAYVTLPPNSTNTVSAYAVDTSGNATTNKQVKFFCTAAGYAPLSIAEQLATVTSGNNADNSFQVSFDTAVYVRISDSTSDGGEVGTYTYTPTGPDTAELVPQQVLPKQGGASNDVLELTFTNAYNATYTDGTNGSGTFVFSATEESVPASLNGAMVIETSVVTNFVTTNIFTNGNFTANGFEGNFAGTYTFTQFTPVGALLVETSSNAGSGDPITNYIVLSFSEGITPPSGNYYSESFGSAGPGPIDAGTFTTTTSAVTGKLVGPVSVFGLQAKVTPILPKGETVYPFTRTFGRGTFASMFIPPGTNFLLFSNAPNDVGIRLSNLHISDDTGVATFMGLAPPYIGVLDDYTTGVLWKSPTSALSTNLLTGEVAALTFSTLKNNAPAALSGMVLTVTPAGTTKTSTFTFNYNNVVGGGQEAGTSGTYTYALYTPTMALVQLNETIGPDSGEVEYVLLNFESSGGGAYVGSKFSGAWELRPGTFKITK
jgi:hypothetical protein